MSARQLPLLCHNTEVYRGPCVPTYGLKGHIRAEGLAAQDLVAAFGMLADGSVKFLGNLDTNITDLIFNPKEFQYVRVGRSKSGGNPVSVWVA
jgi:hypothetical protein